MILYMYCFQIGIFSSMHQSTKSSSSINEIVIALMKCSDISFPNTLLMFLFLMSMYLCIANQLHIAGYAGCAGRFDISSSIGSSPSAWNTVTVLCLQNSINAPSWTKGFLSQELFQHEHISLWRTFFTGFGNGCDSPTPKSHRIIFAFVIALFIITTSLKINLQVIHLFSIFFFRFKSLASSFPSQVRAWCVTIAFNQGGQVHAEWFSHAFSWIVLRVIFMLHQFASVWLSSVLSQEQRFWLIACIRWSKIRSALPFALKLQSLQDSRTP